MKRYLDCDGFHERLDLFRLDELSAEEMESMRDHARSCRECELALRVEEHLEVMSGEAEEVAGSPEAVGTVWSGVEGEIFGGARLRHVSQDRRDRSWMLAAAAGIALLAVGAGYLAVEVGRLRRYEASLEQLVAEQGRRLDELETASSAAGSAGLSRTMLWEPLLARRESLSVAEVRSILDLLPPGTTILSAREAVSLLERLSGVRGLGIREALGRIDLDDGLQAVEMGSLLDAVNLSPDRRISTARVLALYRGSPESPR